MDLTTPPVALIGLGNAGLALATPLLKTRTVIGYDRQAERIRLAAAAGIRAAASAKEAAAQCDAILLSLPTPQASLSAMADLAEGGGDALRGRLVIETSTVGPRDVDALGRIAAAHGASVVDAAIVGGVHRLTEGRTTFLMGATDADHARARAVLEAAAERIFHLGPPGSGMRAKLVNNAVAHTTMVMLIEAAALAARAGVPMDVFYELMQRDSGLTRPLTHRFGERIRRQDFDGGMSTANARKDSLLALELAQELGVPLFTMQASHTVYEIAGRGELAGLDYAAISKLWEAWTGVRFGDDR